MRIHLTITDVNKLILGVKTFGTNTKYKGVEKGTLVELELVMIDLHV